jgi:hypothetical protein
MTLRHHPTTVNPESGVAPVRQSAWQLSGCGAIAIDCRGLCDRIGTREKR